MVSKKTGISLVTVAAAVAILGTLHGMGWLPAVQAQVEELQEQIDQKADSPEEARRHLMVVAAALKGYKSDYEDARFRLGRDPADEDAREDKIDAEIAIETAREAQRELRAIWKGTE